MGRWNGFGGVGGKRAVGKKPKKVGFARGFRLSKKKNFSTRGGLSEVFLAASVSGD